MKNKTYANMCRATAMIAEKGYDWDKANEKLEEQGKKLVKVARFYPSSKRCSRCGKVKKELKLSERIYICECGNVMDRDKNAAVNIREEARRMLTA